VSMLGLRGQIFGWWSRSLIYGPKIFKKVDRGGGAQTLPAGLAPMKKISNAGQIPAGKSGKQTGLGGLPNF